MNAIEKLKRAHESAAKTKAALQAAAMHYTRSPYPGDPRPWDALELAAKKHTNAKHEVGRAEKAVRELNEAMRDPASRRRS